MFGVDRSAARHLFMRLGLGFVLGWFGAHEILNPSDWTVFIPGFVGDLSPLSPNNLVVLHGFLLLLASASVLFGLLYVPGALLASALLTSIVFGLWLDDGVDDLVIRDLGLLALAIALSVDSVRTWHLDGLLSRLPADPGTDPARRKIVPISMAVVSLRTSVLLGMVLALSVVLYESGGGLPEGSVASLTTDHSQTPSATGGSAAPAPAKLTATSILFNDWSYKKDAFQIYPGEASADTKKALAGFQLSVQDQGTSVLITLKAASPRYKDAQYSVDKGATAYFIETTMRDDPAGAENNLRDDGVIAVNPQGYILEG